MKKILAWIASDKLEEYQHFWKQYHIDIVAFPPLETYEDSAILNVLQMHYGKDPQVLCAMTECTTIKDDCLITTLWLVDAKGAFVQSTDPLSVRVDRDRPALGLGWDNQVILPNGYSCYEMAQMGCKNIGRQHVFSVMAERLCYDTYKTWNHLQDSPKNEVLHFDDTLHTIITTNPYLSHPSVQDSFLGPLFTKAVHNAGFVRTGNTRKLRNYWLPGLNAGIPAVPKPDLFHETTFLVHDLCHFIFPDVVYNGDPSTLTHYHIARMASEAITMTFADMWFVDAIKSHYDYDYTKRAIYPLFEKVRSVYPDITPYEMAWLNVQYAVMGDTSGYERYIEITDPVWVTFDHIYSRFFIEDHHWTFHNRESMRMNSHAYKEFTNDYYDMLIKQHLTLSMNITNVKEIFDHMWSTYIEKVEPSNAGGKTNYWLGQGFIFYQYPNFGNYKKEFYKALSVNDIPQIEKIYKEYLYALLENYFINQDEYYHFSHIYPFFKPHYVFYERKTDEKLEDIAKKYICEE